MVESLLEILTKRRSQVFYKPVDVHSVTNAIGESISSITMWNIVNQLGKFDFSCGLVVNHLKERQFFSDQMNKNQLMPQLCCKWNNLTIKNGVARKLLLNQV